MTATPEPMTARERLAVRLDVLGDDVVALAMDLDQAVPRDEAWPEHLRKPLCDAIDRYRETFTEYEGLTVALMRRPSDGFVPAATPETK